VSYHNSASSSLLSSSSSSSSKAISDRDSSTGSPSSLCWRRCLFNASCSRIFLFCCFFVAS
jgi:hypothetical protein